MRLSSVLVLMSAAAIAAWGQGMPAPRAPATFHFGPELEITADRPLPCLAEGEAVYVPARFALEHLGFRVYPYELSLGLLIRPGQKVEPQKITTPQKDPRKLLAQGPGGRLILTVDSARVDRSKRQREIARPVVYRENRVMAPLELFSEILECEVEYDQAQKEGTIVGEGHEVEIKVHDPATFAEELKGYEENRRVEWDEAQGPRFHIEPGEGRRRFKLEPGKRIVIPREAQGLLRGGYQRVEIDGKQWLQHGDIAAGPLYGDTLYLSILKLERRPMTARGPRGRE